MARIPIITEHQVRLQPVPDAKFRPVDTGGIWQGFGEGLQTLGQAGQDYARAQARIDAQEALAEQARLAEDRARVEDDLDEAEVRRADNAFVALSHEALHDGPEPYYALRDRDAVAAQAVVAKRLARQAAELRNGLRSAQAKGMFDPVIERRLGAINAEMAAFGAAQGRNWNQAESARRQRLAMDEMVRSAAAGAAADFEAGRKVLASEIAGSAQRDGLSGKAVQAAEAQALAIVHGDVVRRIAAEDPLRAQAHLDAHRATIGVRAAALDAELKPYVDHQRAETLAGEIRDAGGPGDTLDAQLGRLRERGLPPETADPVARQLVERDRQAAAIRRAAQRQAADQAWDIARDPASISIRAIQPSLHAALAEDDRAAILETLSANARGEDPSADPALYLRLADEVADGTLTEHEVRHAWAHLPRRDREQVAQWLEAMGEEGVASEISATMRRVRAASGISDTAAEAMSLSASGAGISPHVPSVSARGIRYFVQPEGQDGQMGLDTSRSALRESARQEVDRYQRDARIRPLHHEALEFSQRYPPDRGTREWNFREFIRTSVRRRRQFKEQWISGYRRSIIAAARRFDIPASLLAAIAVEEVSGDPTFFDYWAYVTGSDARRQRVSFGNYSIQLRRAAQTLGYRDALTDWQTRSLMRTLENPGANIFIAAKHISDLRNIDFSGVRGDQLTRDQMLVIATRYNRGPDLTLAEIMHDMGYGHQVLRKMDEAVEYISERRKR